MQYIHKNQHDKFFTYSKDIGYQSLKEQHKHFPFLLVNVGTGTSIMKFISEHEFQRVSGTSIGGGLFLGLSNLLIKEKNFDEVLKMSNEGKSDRVKT